MGNVKEEHRASQPIVAMPVGAGGLGVEPVDPIDRLADVELTIGDSEAVNGTGNTRDECVLPVTEAVLLLEVLPVEETDFLIEMVAMSCTVDVAVVEPTGLDWKACDGVSTQTSDENEAVQELQEGVGPVGESKEEGATREERGWILVEVDGSAHAEGLLLQRLAS